jgi:glycosyltransferase involved in cell wall biosynthesis
MERLPLTVTIITLNEAENLPRALDSVRWADDVVVVDSGSTDATCEIARAAGARVFVRKWEGYGQQKNFAQDQARHDWVLNLDADEAVSPELAASIRLRLTAATLETPGTPVGFALSRRTWYLGRWILHGGWYPNRLIRFAHRRHARWSEPELHEDWKVDGPVARLEGDLLHYSFRDIEDQVRTNLHYARKGAGDLARRGRPATLLHLILKPVGKFIETYLLKRGFLDGIAGLIISINAAHSIFLKYAYVLEPRLTPESEKPHGKGP